MWLVHTCSLNISLRHKAVYSGNRYIVRLEFHRYKMEERIITRGGGEVGGRPHPTLMVTWLMGKATSGSSDLTKKNTISQ